MTTVMWLVVVLLSGAVSAWYAYWIGRERGYLEGMDRGAHAFQEGLDEGLAELADQKRDEVIREVLRTGDAHYTDGEGIVRRIETKKR